MWNHITGKTRTYTANSPRASSFNQLIMTDTIEQHGWWSDCLQSGQTGALVWTEAACGELNNESHGFFFSAAAGAAARSDSHERSTTPFINNFNLSLGHICCLCLNSALLEADQPVPGAAAAAAAVQARFMLTVKVTRKKKTLAGNKRGERL